MYQREAGGKAPSKYPQRSLQEVVSQVLGELTAPRRPVTDPERYVDPSQAPKEGYGATAIKNLVGAAMAAQPDPIELHTPGDPIAGIAESTNYIDPTFGMGSMGHMDDLKKAFPDLRKK